MRNNKAMVKSNVVRRFKDACNDIAEVVNEQLLKVAAHGIGLQMW